MNVVFARKLGRLPSRRDKRTLKLAKYLNAPVLGTPPASCDRTAGIQNWGTMLNDQLGDCAIAVPGHMIMAWSTAKTGSPIIVPDQAILKAYEDVGGYRPGHPETDNGCNIGDVMNYLRNTGLASADGDFHRTWAYARVDPHDHYGVMWSIRLFGGVDIGINLCSAWQNLGPNDVWDAGRGWGYNPGSWGGHSMAGEFYDADHLGAITWGYNQLLTWPAWDEYVDECWTCISPDWIAPDGVDVDGIDLATLHADLQAVTEQPQPQCLAMLKR